MCLLAHTSNDLPEVLHGKIQYPPNHNRSGLRNTKHKAFGLLNLGHRQNLPETASVANYEGNGRLNAPSASRNTMPIVELVRKTVLKSGKALEIASGTGQHIVKLASALPHLCWQPSDVDEARIKSIRSWSDDERLKNLKSPCLLDATEEGWASEHRDQDLILLVNLLHLISTRETKVLVKEMSKALVSRGLAIIYGPFMRSGKLISKGDMEFHHSLISTDPNLGYKNDIDMLKLYDEAGLIHLSTENMPANNLAFILQKP